MLWMLGFCRRPPKTLMKVNTELLLNDAEWHVNSHRHVVCIKKSQAPSDYGIQENPSTNQTISAPRQSGCFDPTCYIQHCHCSLAFESAPACAWTNGMEHLWKVLTQKLGVWWSMAILDGNGSVAVFFPNKYIYICGISDAKVKVSSTFAVSSRNRLTSAKFLIKVHA